MKEDLDSLWLLRCLSNLKLKKKKRGNDKASQCTGERGDHGGNREMVPGAHALANLCVALHLLIPDLFKMSLCTIHYFYILLM